MDHRHTHSAAAKNKRRLELVLALTAAYMVAEFIAGWLTQSLALIADAGHMLTDVAASALALFAIRMAERPATPERTYGYYRMEILAALVNGVVLIGIAFYILYEAYGRFRNPAEVASGPMLVVAVGGLLINLLGLRLLHAAAKESLNMKGAYLELLSDMLASVAVIAAAIVMLTTGWYYADPIISAGIAVFILPRTWMLLRDAVGVLLEGTPADVNVAALREAIADVHGVAGVHDLHVWSLTSGVNAMSVHAVLGDHALHDDVLAAVQKRVSAEFNIHHATVQVECEGCAFDETHL